MNNKMPQLEFNKDKACPFRMGTDLWYRECVETDCAWWDRRKKQCILFTITELLEGGRTDE